MVSGTVAVFIIESFEIIQVKHNKGKNSPIPAVSLPFFLHFLIKVPVIVYLCKAIGNSQFFNLFIEHCIGHGNCSLTTQTAQYLDLLLPKGVWFFFANGNYAYQ